MKNTLGDLNNHLFAQLERLGDEDIKGEELQQEINRAKAISDIATQVISNADIYNKIGERKKKGKGRGKR